MRRLLFSLDRLEFQGGGKALVAGRCCGDPMKAGDRAQIMVQLSVGETVVASEPVSITMPEFLVYNQNLDTLESGLTAGLLLSVEAARGLRLGWYLKGENV
jgi:hypothetical protein